MSKELYGHAAEGDLETLCEAAFATGEEEGEQVVFQWLQVAASLGHEAAEEMADDIYEAALSRGGDETVAALHYEVATWFARGEQGVVVNVEHALTQLACAQELQLRESMDLDVELKKLRGSFSGVDERRFDEIFPGLV
ncbi:MAG: hypothetical protein ACI9KE_002836 [Polyangiales bacterium]|jgi:hypothetical protein